MRGTFYCTTIFYYEMCWTNPEISKKFCSRTWWSLGPFPTCVILLFYGFLTSDGFHPRFLTNWNQCFYNRIFVTVNLSVINKLIWGHTRSSCKTSPCADSFLLLAVFSVHGGFCPQLGVILSVFHQRKYFINLILYRVQMHHKYSEVP